jgi:hypothetical protein
MFEIMVARLNPHESNSGMENSPKPGGFTFGSPPVITGRHCQSIHPSVRPFKWHRWFFSYHKETRWTSSASTFQVILRCFLKSCRFDKFLHMKSTRAHA